MCEAKPGVRCATDTRAAATVTLDIYYSNYPDGPPVDAVTAGEQAFSQPDTCRDEVIEVPDPGDPDGMPAYFGSAADAGDQLAPGVYEANSPYDSARYRLTVHEPDPATPSLRATSDGQYTTVVGNRYDPDRHPNDTAKLVRSEVRALAKSGDLPQGFKYRVTRGHGWTSLNVHMESENESDYFRPAEPHERDQYGGRDQVLREDVRDAAKRLSTLARSYTKNTSDIQTDYHSGAHVFVYGRGGHVLA